MALALALFVCIPMALSAQTGRAAATSPANESELLEILIPLSLVVSTEQVRTLVTGLLSDTMELLAVSQQPLLDVMKTAVSAHVMIELYKLSKDGWLTVEELAKVGIALTFDFAEFTGQLVIPSRTLRPKQISVHQARQYPPYPEVANAAFAVGLPYWLQHRGTIQRETNPVRDYSVQAAPGVYLNGWVLESDLRFELRDDTQDLNTSFEAGNTRLVRSWEPSATRLQLGQIAPFARGLQSSRSVLGVSVDNLEADTSRSIVPILFDRPFVMPDAGRIDVFLNGRRSRSYPVQPGQYEILNFPLSSGINAIRVEYVRADGTIESYRAIVPHAGGLLKRGALSYAMAAGYDTGSEPAEFVASGFARFGVAEKITAGALAQGSEQGAQLGLEATAATAFGEPSIGLFGSSDYAESLGWAAQVGYRLTLGAARYAPNLSVTTEYRDPAFGGAQFSTTILRPSWNTSASVTQLLPAEIGLTVGYVERRYHHSELVESRLFGAIGRALGPWLNMRLTASLEPRDPAGTWTAAVTISGQPRSRAFNGSATTDVQTGVTDLNVSTGHQGPVSFAGTARARGIDPVARTINGISASARAFNERFDFAGSAGFLLDPANSVIEQQLRSTSYAVQFGSGLYLADGAIAIGAPTRAPFALVRPARELDTRVVSVRSSGRSLARESGILGPAFLGPLTPGGKEPVVVDVPGLPADFGLGQTEFLIAPRYRSGTLITIVPSRSLYVRGRLLDDRGQAVVFKALEITPRFDLPVGVEALGGPTFTDDEGVFEMYGLIPGFYSIVLRDGTERSAAMLVPDEAGPLVIIGDIRIERGSQ